MGKGNRGGEEETMGESKGKRRLGDEGKVKDVGEGDVLHTF